MDKSMIQIRDLQLILDNRTILDISSADIPCVGIVACIGANGAGKTTLLKVLHGIVRPQQGCITMPLQNSNSALRSALVLHHTPMIRASVRTNINLVSDSPYPPQAGAVDEMLQEIGLAHLAQAPAKKLSAGERQKLCIGRARLLKPQLVLLDEPTANLDPTATEQVEELIRVLAKEKTGVIFSSHQLAQVQRLANYIIFMADGKIIECGTPAEFFNNPQTAAAKQFLKFSAGLLV